MSSKEKKFRLSRKEMEDHKDTIASIPLEKEENEEG